jgi:hypothetical protein
MAYEENGEWIGVAVGGAEKHIAGRGVWLLSSLSKRQMACYRDIRRFAPELKRGATTICRAEKKMKSEKEET